MENIDKNEIVKKITSEVLVEVKKSSTKITSEELKNKIQNNITILENASPQTILDRGYSMVTDENNNIIRDSKQISKDDKIIIRPAKGKIISKVIEN